MRDVFFPRWGVTNSVSQMGLGGGGGAEVDDVVARAEKLSAEAVSHVFLTLCGTAEAPDKFTGMQVRAWFPWQPQRECGRDRVSARASSAP